MKSCRECHHTFPKSQSLCPHCARPALYPNVEAAEELDELNKLQQRYDAALADANSRGVESAVIEFENAVSGAKAVIARPLSELMRLAQNDREMYASFYELVEARVRVPTDKGWDKIRVLADSALFPHYKENIRFAALTLNEEGLPYYGECYFILRDDLIAHRASVFEENSGEWTKRHKINIKEVDNLPVGFRATWSQRGKLAVAKLSNKITTTTTTDSFPSLLLQPKPPAPTEDFIEVHIWGPLTIRAVEKVKGTSGGTKKQIKARAVILEAVEETLLNNGITNVTVEVSP